MSVKKLNKLATNKIVQKAIRMLLNHPKLKKAIKVYK